MIDDNFSSVQVSPAYDDNGNLTDDGLYVYKYDPWNRLVQVKRKGGPQPTVAEYTYDGLGRRIRKVVSNSGDRDRTESFYYAGWQLVEARNSSDVAMRQFVWGTTYIDEAICMNVNTDPQSDSDCIEDGGSVRYLYMQDANWNVVRVWSDNVTTGTYTERYEYDPYGLTRVLAGYNSGEGHEDLNVVGASQLAASNPIRYAGYYFDDETGLYHVRNRMYSPSLQRWTQRDPLGYVTEMSLYAYGGCQPEDVTDAFGLFWGCTSRGICPPGSQPRSKAECCLEAKRPPPGQSPLDYGHAGGIVCCDGRKVSCSWWYEPDTPQGDFLEKLLGDCIVEHEDTHWGDVPDCPQQCPHLDRAGYGPGADRAGEECEGYTAELECLEKALKRCKRAPNPTDCRKRVQDRIAVVQSRKAYHCAGNYP